MEYVKEGCNTPVKNACKSTNMLQLLKFSFCSYQIFHEYRTYFVLTNSFFVFDNFASRDSAISSGASEVKEAAGWYCC
jgi:hypothetical protein